MSGGSTLTPTDSLLRVGTHEWDTTPNGEGGANNDRLNGWENLLEVQSQESPAGVVCDLRVKLCPVHNSLAIGNRRRHDDSSNQYPV